MPLRPSRLASLALIAVAACGDGSRDGGGTVIIGAAADADALLPGIVRSIQGRIASELMFDRIAEMTPTLQTAGDSGFAPRLAQSWTWSNDSLRLTLRFDPRATWHDGRPVRSSDYAFALRLVRDPALASSLAADVASIDSIAIPDSLTAVIHFGSRDAEQFYAATLLVPVPEHIYGGIATSELRQHAAARAPVGSGRYRFVAWEPDVRIELNAVTDHYRGAPKPYRVILAKSADPASGVARVWAEETDLWDPLTPDLLAEAERYPHVRVMSGPGFDYGFAAFNFRSPSDAARPHPVLADLAMRRALTMAIDRASAVRTVLGPAALPSFGPFVRAQVTADTTIPQIAFDRAEAERLLDSLGWRRGADGLRARGASPLRLTILSPTSSATRMRLAAVLQEQWRAAGVDVRVEGLEFQTFLERMGSGRFDIALNAWRTTPSPRGIRSTWGSERIAGGSRQNAGRYTSDRFDEAVLAALATVNPQERIGAFRRAYRIAVEDAPALWLYEARSVIAVHNRFTIPAWRTDAWWLTIPDWSLARDRALPRDAAPTPAP